jgi:hypothetical protein
VAVQPPTEAVLGYEVAMERGLEGMAPLVPSPSRVAGGEVMGRGASRTTGGLAGGLEPGPHGWVRMAGVQG